MERLKIWKWVAFVPIVLIWFLGWVVVACNPDSIGFVIAIIWAVVLPTAWSLVAMGIVLCLGTKRRSSISGTRQPVLFFIFWGISSVVTRFKLLEFPGIKVGAWLTLISLVNILIIFPVIAMFVLQCLADSRK